MTQRTIQFDTSAAAAAAIARRAPVLRRQVLAFIASRGHCGATDEEIALATQLRESTARARRCELRDNGQVRDSGQRRNVSSGNKARVWIATGVPLI
ncbi:MAG: hypothetical protein WD851_18650 [Pirellulales bacterium]